jgi:hypothetical protein
MDIGVQNIRVPPLQDRELELQFSCVEIHAVHRVPTRRFRMIHAETMEELGGINLRYGSTPHIARYAGHVGFSVHPFHRVHRYASRSLILPYLANKIDSWFPSYNTALRIQILRADDVARGTYTQDWACWAAFAPKLTPRRQEPVSLEGFLRGPPPADSLALEKMRGPLKWWRRRMVVRPCTCMAATSRASCAGFLETRH